MLDPADEKVAQLLSQTDAQMQRLGWTVAQGKEHLQKYYGVRSRLQLNEEELDNFLLFLQLTDAEESPKSSQ
ncbi:hypothetical protein [Nostoc sp. CCY 9925]|uniref:hypothetical protein n=1 Tax=Nostoc sp. CCY 9925 TaxID=3103865 RepID=UPI0039C7591F